MTPSYQIAAYYFPQYHRDPRNDRWHGPGWTEWDLLRQAQPRFPDHQQPKIPLWGYADEADPDVAALKIDAAADHGITAFIHDWYWYENAPFLNGALEQGFLRAPNCSRLPFALMWANHDWMNLFPASGILARAPLLARGAVSPAEFEAVAEYIVRTYFTHPAYWKIDGRPYFSIYELMNLVRGLGGVEQTREALESFQAKARAIGYPGIHLNAVVWGMQALPGTTALASPAELLAQLGVASVTSYVWIHHTPLTSFPTAPYPAYARAAAAEWETLTRQFTVPYYPNVTMGWDPSPRTRQAEPYENLGYPYMPILTDNAPQEFGAALRQARAFLDRGLTTPPILTINAWNEWTEGSYLEPDTTHGLGYLEQIERVFGGRA